MQAGVLVGTSHASSGHCHFWLYHPEEGLGTGQVEANPNNNRKNSLSMCSYGMATTLFVLLLVHGGGGGGA